MDKNNVVSAEIVRQITRMVVEELQKQQRLERSTPIGVSNRHVHLDLALLHITEPTRSRGIA